MATGGTYAFGFGAKNDPTSAKIVFTVTDDSYTNAAAVTTKARTVYGVPCIQPNVGAMRKAYPNDANPSETASGSDVIIRVALSNHIFDDSVVTVSIGAGFYTESGHASNACTDKTCTNNSTLGYEDCRVVGNWAWPYQRYIATGNFSVEFQAYHKFGESGKPVACVVITATDEHSHSVNYTVTTVTKSTRSDYDQVLGYIQTINVSTLTTKDLITINAKAYPWIGDSTSVLDTGDAAFSFPTPHYTDLKVRLFKSGEFGHIKVDATNGNDATGTVYATQIQAEEGSACKTIASALAKLQTYHNTNYSRNTAGGGWIYCTEDSHELNTDAGGTLTEWVTLTKVSAAVKSNVIISALTSNASVPNYIRFYNVQVTDPDHWWRFDPNNAYGVLEECSLNTAGGGNPLTFYNTDYACIIGCTGTFAGPGWDTAWHIVRGNNFTNSAIFYNLGIITGNRNVMWQERTASSYEHGDGGVWSFNDSLDISYTDPQLIVGSSSSIDTYTHGLAVIQSVFERHGTATQQLVALGGDSSIVEVSNVIMWHCTFAGARNNQGYNDVATSPPYPRLCWSVKNNIFSNFNNKDDTFVNNASCTGAWPVGYWVGASGNFVRTTANDEWQGEFPCGLWSVYGTSLVPIEPGYRDDKSCDGDNGGGGNYHLTEGGTYYDLAKEQLLPYDLAGNARLSPGAPGAYEYLEVGFPAISMAMNRMRNG
jgi:hypothetical protein